MMIEPSSERRPYYSLRFQVSLFLFPVNAIRTNPSLEDIFDSHYQYQGETLMHPPQKASQNPYGIQVHRCQTGCLHVQFGYTMVHLHEDAARELTLQLCAAQPEAALTDLILTMQVSGASGTMA